MACVAIGGWLASLGAETAVAGAAGSAAAGAGTAAAAGAASGAFVGGSTAAGLAAGAGAGGLGFGATTAAGFGTGLGAAGTGAAIGAGAALGAGALAAEGGSVFGLADSAALYGLGESAGAGAFTLPATDALYGLGTAAEFGAAGTGAFGGAGGTGFGFSDLGGLYKAAQPYLSIGSGLKGLLDAEEQKKRAAELAKRADPFGASGGRALADSQLQALLADPAQVAAGDPAYKLRLQAAARRGAPMGVDSGAFAIGAADASTDWFNARLAQLGGLAGASVNPAAGAGLELQGLYNASDLTSKGLGSIGFGVNEIAGGNTSTMPPAVRQWLQQQARLG